MIPKINKKMTKSQMKQIRKAAKNDIPDVIDKLFDLLDTGMELFAEEQKKQSAKTQKEKQKKQKDKE